MNTKYLQLMVALSALALGGLAKADGHDNGMRHYLSLGTSLAVGIQPDENGENRRTDEGYADQLHELIEPEDGKLRLTRLGCPGETTVTMINGGICAYELGSQLAQAVEFLEAHKNKVELVTIDMGVNDVLAANCIDAASGVVDQPCLFAAFSQISTNLYVIMATLAQAADPETQIVAMNYYNTFLAAWFPNPTLAVDSVGLADFFNGVVLGGTYAAVGIPVADVAGAFSSRDFGASPLPGVPLNVFKICAYTYMCVAPPVGPNIHANPAGYGLIAATLADTIE